MRQRLFPRLSPLFFPDTFQLAETASLLHNLFILEQNGELPFPFPRIPKRLPESTRARCDRVRLPFWRSERESFSSASMIMSTAPPFPPSRTAVGQPPPHAICEPQMIPLPLLFSNLFCPPCPSRPSFVATGFHMSLFPRPLRDNFFLFFSAFPPPESNSRNPSAKVRVSDVFFFSLFTHPPRPPKDDPTSQIRRTLLLPSPRQLLLEAL